jgi:site-specific DNA recombinase
LAAIAKARVWVADLVDRRINSVAEIARKEEKVERHIRLLLPLAFAPLAIVQAIANGSAPMNTTVIGDQKFGASP